MKKGRAIPDDFMACGVVGKIVNLYKMDIHEIEGQFRSKRLVFNKFLDLNIKKYNEKEKFIFYNEMASMLTHYRMTDQRFSHGGVVYQQTTLIALDRAIKDSFSTKENRKGFPVFKKAGFLDSLTVPAVSVKRLQTGNKITHVKFPKLPLMRVRGITIPEGSRFTTATIRRHGRGLNISFGIVKPKPVYVEPTMPSVGIDMGLKTMATIANNDSGFVQKIHSPRAMKRGAKRIKRAQRIMNKRTKGSVNRRRKAQYLARLHKNVANKRLAHQHRDSRQIVNMAAEISIESLNVKGIMRTHYAKSAADVGMGAFLKMIRYKSDWADRKLNVIGRFQRSTGCCPVCDHVGPRLERGQAKWTCEVCGTLHDRDVAAAQWIDKVGKLLPEPVKDESPQSPKRSSAGKRKPEGAEPGSLTNVSITRELHVCDG